MKTLCLLGSPKVRGNSAVLAARYCETAEKLGSQVQTFILNKLSYSGCQGCRTCKAKSDRCVLKDDLTDVLEAVREADVLVMATPVYFGDVSSQLKGFIDRTVSYVADDDTNPYASRLSPGKTLVFIQTQGDSDEMIHADIFPKYEFFFKKWHGFGETYFILACGFIGKVHVEDCEDVMKLAEETAEKVMA